jgi:fibronectin type 3 domain-containing protein
MPGSEFDLTAWAASAKSYPIESAKAGYHKVEIPAGDWTGKEIVFAVRAQHPRGRVSEWSNLEALQIVPAIVTPRELRADSIAPGVRLTWPAQPELSFRIYRRESAMPQPVLIGTAERPEFLDPAVEYGKTYEYSVQAVRKTGEREAESLISAPVQVSREDRFAPAVPSGLTAVAGTHSVELAWTPSPESDLAGYRIYRAVDAGEFEQIAELLEVPSFSDRSAQPGRRYRYAISSIDRLGNESARSEPLEIMAQ